MPDTNPKGALTPTRPVVVEAGGPNSPALAPAPPRPATDLLVDGHHGQLYLRRWLAEGEDMDGPPPALSVAVPMYNESARIGATLVPLIDYLRNTPFTTRLTLVDDGSTDNTNQIVEPMLAAAPARSLLATTLIKLPANLGKSAAVRAGLWLSQGRRRLVMDADHSTHISQVPALLNAADETGAGLVVGSRALRPDIVKQSFKRKVSHLMFRSWVRLNGFRTVKDSQCGFKLYRADLAETLCAPRTGRSTVSGYEFDLEHIELARLLGHGVAEVPVAWADTPGSKIRLVQDALAMFGGTWRLRQRLSAESAANAFAKQPSRR